MFGRPAFFRRVPAHARLLAAAGACMGAVRAAWFLAIARIGAAVPTLIALCLPPVLVTLWAVLRGRERLDAALLALLAAALCGTALVVLRHGSATGAVPVGTLMEGVALSIASALLYAMFTLVTAACRSRWAPVRRRPGLTVVAAVTMGLAATYTPLAWPAEMPPEAWLLYLGLVTAAIALLAFTWARSGCRPPR